MGIEGMMFSKDATGGRGQEIKKNELKITSAEEYLAMIKLHPLDKIDIDESQRMWTENNRAIEAKVSREQNDALFKRYDQLGFLEEEVGYYPEDEDIIGPNSTKMVDAWLEHKLAGYFVVSVPVYDENNMVIGHKMFRTNKSIVEQKAKEKIKADLEWQGETENRVFYENQEHERLLQEKVHAGEMVYLGEMSIEEFAELYHKGFPNGATEYVWVYDENMKYVENKKKFFARTSKKV